MPAKTLITLLQSTFDVYSVDIGEPRDGVTMAEVYLLEKAAGRTVTAALIRRIDSFKYEGDLSSFVKRQCEICAKFEVKTSGFVSSSLLAMLSSPFCGPRPTVVKVPRPGKLETTKLDCKEQVEAAEPIFGYFPAEFVAESVDVEYDMCLMPAALTPPDFNFDVASVFERDQDSFEDGDDDRIFARHLNVVLNHEAFDDNLDISLRYMSEHDSSARAKRARTTLVPPEPESPEITPPSESHPCPFEEGFS